MNDAPKEQPEAFYEQVEGSLDMRIEELESKDRKKASLLQNLQEKIIEQIRAANDDSNEDLRVTELMEVYDYLEANHAEELEAAGVTRFPGFKELLGFESDESVRYVPAVIGGTEYEFDVPFGLEFSDKQKYETCFRQIEEHLGAKLKMKINKEGVALKAFEDGRVQIHLAINRKGETADYLVGPDGVLLLQETNQNLDEVKRVLFDERASIGIQETIGPGDTIQKEYWNGVVEGEDSFRQKHVVHWNQMIVEINYNDSSTEVFLQKPGGEKESLKRYGSFMCDFTVAIWGPKLRIWDPSTGNWLFAIHENGEVTED